MMLARARHITTVVEREEGSVLAGLSGRVYHAKETHLSLSGQEEVVCLNEVRREEGRQLRLVVCSRLRT
jgi:hypothetical protein